MWLKKTLTGWRLKLLDNHAQMKMPANKPNRQLCHDLLTQLSPALFRDYQPSMGLATMVAVPYPNVEAYTLKLKDAARVIKAGHYLSPDWFSTETFDINLDRFLISDDGFYINHEEAITKFKGAGLQLCQLMEASDTAQHGIHEHNLRMLTKLFINMRILTTQLIAASVGH
jgi:hypothetical protein